MARSWQTRLPQSSPESSNPTTGILKCRPGCTASHDTPERFLVLLIMILLLMIMVMVVITTMVTMMTGMMAMMAMQTLLLLKKSAMMSPSFCRH